MARTKHGPKPYWKESRQSWYVLLPKPGGGRIDIKLGADKDAAFAEFYRIMAKRADGTPGAISGSATVRELIAQFLVWS